MRVLFLAAAVMTVGSGPALSQEYAYCSTAGTSTPQSCSYETLAQCNAAVSGTGVDCYKNPRYTTPVVGNPAPQPVQSAPPHQPKRRTTPASGTKS